MNHHQPARPPLVVTVADLLPLVTLAEQFANKQRWQAAQPAEPTAAIAEPEGDPPGAG